ncbi:GTP cyclohydrolase I FolE [Sedimentisphaera salicampi]|uniref:GTP cyclohydrolase I FolE n=1 Tax=Sedimentisphaera salicampi TaxID=1941349 RepID=UPI000B9AFF4B|nr:GTP cyclohydrolase I FolE [Sedimentisphaera salicampi]OXU16117.1 GTP cyclohydrolase 1 [Sedimentisphaera salicampi]
MSEEKNKTIDHKRIEAAVREILLAIGEDPDREGLAETPQRVARMYEEVFSGLGHQPSEHTEKLFHEDYNEIVVLRDIAFSSTCEHHLMPFSGKAHIAYLPDKHIIGLSKLARVFDCFAKRPQVQERLTIQAADFLMERLNPKGVAVVVEASHSCMTVRGAKKPGSFMVTSALRGIFIKDQRSRSEVMSLIRGAGGVQ